MFIIQFCFSIVNGVPQTEATLQQYTYDNQGNPLSITNFVYDGTTYDHALLSWSGRELTDVYVMSSSGYPIYRIAYTYNDQGYRTKKEISTFNGSGFTINQTIDYELIDDKVIFETDGTFGIMYTYDYDGTLISFNYDSDIDDAYAGIEYFYIRNQMGDISHISNSSGAIVVHYLYDAYGNIVDIDYASGYAAIAEANPYRYRGYRYDSETNLYYLNSRYYNPEVGRFINADGLLGETGNILSTNMYAYCANNPVMNSDENGYKWKLSNIIKSIATVAIIASVVVAACVVGGPVLIGAAIGAVVGTVVGGAIGYNANGLDGAINGALIGAAVGAAVGAIAGYAYQFFSTTGKVATDSITVGKDMGRVGQATTELGSSQYGGMPGYKFIGKLFPKLGEIHNKMWLAKNIAAGKTVFDIGWGLNNVDPGCSYYRETQWMIEFAEKGIEFVRQIISGF